MPPGLGNYVVAPAVGWLYYIECRSPSNQRSGYPVISGLQIVGQSLPDDLRSRRWRTASAAMTLFLTVGGGISFLAGRAATMINSAGRCRYGSRLMRIRSGSTAVLLTFLRDGPVGPVSFGELREIIQP